MAKNVTIDCAWSQSYYSFKSNILDNTPQRLYISLGMPTPYTDKVGVYCPAYTGSIGNSTSTITFPITNSNKTFRVGNKLMIEPPSNASNANHCAHTVMIAINLPEGCGNFKITPYFHSSSTAPAAEENSTFGIISSNISVSAATLEAACEASTIAIYNNMAADYTALDAACNHFQSNNINPEFAASGMDGFSFISSTNPSFTTGEVELGPGIYVLYYAVFTDTNTNYVYPSWSITCTGNPDGDTPVPEYSNVSEFTVTANHINNWAPVETLVVDGSTKYGICVTNEESPAYTFLNQNFYPTATSGSLAIVEIYANSEGAGNGDPNDPGLSIYDGVALVNTAQPGVQEDLLRDNNSIYGVNASTKQTNYVYSFNNNGYTNTKIMAISGKQNRNVFVIRSWGTLNVNYNKPYIAFLGDSSVLKYNNDSVGYSVGLVGASVQPYSDTWMNHNAGDGKRYFAITNTVVDLNEYIDIGLEPHHEYRFTLHAHSEEMYDGVAICKNINDLQFSELANIDVLGGDASTGTCSGENQTTTFTYTVGDEEEIIYIYFKSDGSGIGCLVDDGTGTGNDKYDGISFADVRIEDLGDRSPNMYFKKAGSWVPVKEVYKMVNGAWVKQDTTTGNIFSAGGKYLGRYLDGSTWKNLIDEIP